MPSDVRAELLALARSLLPEGTGPGLVVTIEAGGVTVILEDKPATKLTAVEQAIAIFLRDPQRSVRAIAAEIGCSHSVLSENETFKRLRAAFAGTVHRGRKSKDGRLEADDEQEADQ